MVNLNNSIYGSILAGLLSISSLTSGCAALDRRIERMVQTAITQYDDQIKTKRQTTLDNLRKIAKNNTYCLRNPTEFVPVIRSDLEPLLKGTEINNIKRHSHATAIAYASDDEYTYFITNWHAVVSAKSIREPLTIKELDSIPELLYVNLEKNPRIVDNGQDTIESDDIELKIVKLIPEYDAAILKSKRLPGVEDLTINYTPPKVGDELWVIGFPLAYMKHVTEGTVSNDSIIIQASPVSGSIKTQRIENAITINTIGPPGSSGSGVYRESEDGNLELVAIVNTSLFYSRSHEGLIIGSDKSQDWLTTAVPLYLFQKYLNR